MKTYLTAVILLISLTTMAQEKIKWMTMNDALAAQKETPKKIFMDVYTKWCGPCKLMDRNTFQNKKVAAFLLENQRDALIRIQVGKLISETDFYLKFNADAQSTKPGIKQKILF